MTNLGPQFEIKGGIVKLFEDDETNFVALKASATLAGDITFTLPVAQPTVTGYVLSSTTAGVMSWVVNGAPTGADLTASTGLTITAGSGTAALLVAATLAIDQSFSPTWTGQHLFDIGNVDFRNTAAYSTTPTTLLKGSIKYNAGGSYSTVAQMTMAKENATDGNNAGRWSASTRPNAGSMTERLLIDSAGVVNIPNLTASKFVGTDSSKNLISLDGGIANTSVEVIGSSTDYTFSSSAGLEEIDFGAGDPTLSLPDAGTYFIYGTILNNSIIGSTITFAAQFKQTSGTPALLGVEVVWTVGSATLNAIVTIAGAETVKLFARCTSTVGAPKITSTGTLVGYVKLS